MRLESWDRSNRVKSGKKKLRQTSGIGSCQASEIVVLKDVKEGKYGAAY